MKKEQEKYGFFTIIYGDWSGYTSGQSRNCHIDWLPRHDAERLKLRYITFTDGTTLNIRTATMTFQELLGHQIERKLGYTSLLEKSIATGKDHYVVGQ